MNSSGTTPHLADIHLPPAVSLFPWAPGWWLLLAVGAGTAALLIWAWCKRRQRLTYRRNALAELHDLTTLDDHQLAQALNQLLRRVALQCHSRQQVAGLTGEQWQRFLTDPDQAGAMPSSSAQRLLEAAYNPQAELSNRQQLINDVEQWIRKHRRAIDV